MINQKYFSLLPFKPYYVVIAIIILIIGFLSQSYLQNQYLSPNTKFRWIDNIVFQSSGFLVWGLLSPLVYISYKKLSLINQLLFRFTTLFFFSVVAGLMHRFLSDQIYFTYQFFVNDTPLFTTQFFKDMLYYSPRYIVYSTFGCIALIIVFFAIEQNNKVIHQKILLAETETKLQKAKLNALRLQLNPHFLFNSFNTVVSLIDEKPYLAKEMLMKFSDFLRVLLDKEVKQFITLEEEIRNTKYYLDIEQLRFSDRLEIEYKIQESCEKKMVPNLLLQPLVENAIKHGFYDTPRKGKIRIEAKIIENILQLSIEDNGQGVEKIRDIERKGIGISNTKERLENLYKDQYKFTIHSEYGENFKVVISLPIKQ